VGNTRAATVGNMRAAPTYCRAASYHCATSYHGTAAINSAAIVSASTAILIVWITVATAIISARTYNSPSHDGSPSNGHATAIRGTTSVSTASVSAASVTAAAAGPDLHNLILISRNRFGEMILWNSRNRRTDRRRQSKKQRAGESRDGQLCIEFHRFRPSWVLRFLPALASIQTV
jgi:hypothetical protein